MTTHGYRKKTKFHETPTIHLDNGVPVCVLENHLAPTVSAQAWVRTGSAHEEEFLGHGLSHFLEHMIFQGSKKYSASKILDVVHSNGGEMNAYTSFDHTVYHLDLLSNASGDALDMLADVVANPLFPQKAFKTEKNVILREKAMSDDDPDSVMGDKLRKSVFSIHPARVPIIGESGLIEAVDRTTMREYFERRYTVERMFFVVVGDITANEVSERLNHALETFERSRPGEPFLPREPERKLRTVSSVRFNDPLARVAFGFLTPEATASDIPALDVAAMILGHGKSSRLVDRLRNQKRLALNAHAYHYSAAFGGMFTVYAACQPDKTDELVNAMTSEISELAENTTEKEVERSRKQISASLLRATRSNDGTARIIGESLLYHGDTNHAAEYLAAIDALTAKDIKRVASKYLPERKSAVVAMLPEGYSPNRPATKSAGKKSAVPQGPGLTVMSGMPRLVSLEDDSTQLVDIAIVMPGGTILEGRNKAGLTRLTATMLKTGTKSFDETALASLLDDNAISLSIGGGDNSLVIRVNCLKECVDDAVAATRSILSEPLFSEDAFERERAIAIEALKTRNMSPQRAAEDALRREIFGDHPYSNPSAGLEDSLAAMTAEDLRDFRANIMLDAKKTVIGIAGPLERSEAVELAGRVFEGVPWLDAPSKPLPHPPKFPSKPKSEYVTLPREQSVVMLGMPGCANTHKDRFALDILQVALSGLETRLFKAIRSDEGLAYFAGMCSSRGLHPGFLAFYAGTSPEGVNKTLSIMKREKAKLAKNGLTAKEFEMSIARVKGEAAETLLNSGRMIFECALSEYYGNPYDEPWNISRIYADLSKKRVDAIIAKHLSEKGVVSIVAGPKRKKQR